MDISAHNALDFYKTDHRRQYPANTTLVYSNETPRSDKHAKNLPDYDHKVVNFGIQGVVKWLLIDMWNTTFFNKPLEEAVGKYKRRIERSIGVKDFDVSHLEALHRLGYLPIKIKALPEGSRVNIRVATYTIVNTLPEFFWLVNYLETQLQSELWKSKTTATMAYEYRRLFMKYAKDTGIDETFIDGQLNFVDFQGHDFSMRGMSGIHDAAQSGAAHLLSFTGTDTVSAIEYVEKYYNKDEEFVGGSVPATEHAVMCMGGKDDEIGTYRRLILEIYPSGILSIVSDTWDFWKVITEYTKELKDEIMARDGKVVLRPDSGDPVEIICGSAQDFSEKESLLEAINAVQEYNNSYEVEDGDKPSIDVFCYKGRYFETQTQDDSEIEVNEDDDIAVEEQEYLEDNDMREIVPTPEMKGAVECLWDIFGGTTTKTRYRTLDQHIGLIYGDSINLDRAQRILAGMKKKGFSSANIVFGIGSFTYQYVTRDTYGIAVKATFGIVNGEEREIFKSPKTDDGMKKSAVGLIRIEKEGNDFVQYDRQTWEQEAQGELREIFRDSKLIIDEKYDTVRSRLYAA